MRSNTNARNIAVISASCCISLALLSACGGSGSGGVAPKPDSAFLPPPDPVVKAKYDGTGPNRVTLAHDGYLYGTTITGGDYGYGTVFRISPDGVETVIHSFGARPAEGANPVGLIQGSDGNLYGTTQYGGMASCPRPVPLILPAPGHNFDYTGCGTVFKLSQSGELTVLHLFTGGADGREPYTSLVEASPGHFYGETSYGGIINTGCPTDGCGVVFGFTPAGDERTVYSLTGEAGALPVGLVLGKDGNLYGTAMRGGQFNRGAVFKLTPAGVQSVLHSFEGVAADSAEYPNGPLAQGSDGNFYGTTLYGGFPQPVGIGFCEAGCGTIFRITPTGDMGILYTFADITYGAIPTGALIAAGDNTLYGVAAYGGNTTLCPPQAGCGTVYKLAPPGVISTVYRFDDPVAPPAIQPHFPYSLVRSDSGELYGTAAGGEFGEGMVFKISSAGTVTVLHSFRGP